MKKDRFDESFSYTKMEGPYYDTLTHFRCGKCHGRLGARPGDRYAECVGCRQAYSAEEVRSLDSELEVLPSYYGQGVSK